MVGWVVVGWVVGEGVVGEGVVLLLLLGERVLILLDSRKRRSRMPIATCMLLTPCLKSTEAVLLPLATRVVDVKLDINPVDVMLVDTTLVDTRDANPVVVVVVDAQDREVVFTRPGCRKRQSRTLIATCTPLTPCPKSTAVVLPLPAMQVVVEAVQVDAQAVQVVQAVEADAHALELRILRGCLQRQFATPSLCAEILGLPTSKPWPSGKLPAGKKPAGTSSTRPASLQTPSSRGTHSTRPASPQKFTAKAPPTVPVEEMQRQTSRLHARSAPSRASPTPSWKHSSAQRKSPSARCKSSTSTNVAGKSKLNPNPVARLREAAGMEDANQCNTSSSSSSSSITTASSRDAGVEEDDQTSSRDRQTTRLASTPPTTPPHAEEPETAQAPTGGLPTTLLGLDHPRLPQEEKATNTRGPCRGRLPAHLPLPLGQTTTGSTRRLDGWATLLPLSGPRVGGPPQATPRASRTETCSPTKSTPQVPHPLAPAPTSATTRWPETANAKTAATPRAVVASALLADQPVTVPSVPTQALETNPTPKSMVLEEPTAVTSEPGKPAASVPAFASNAKTSHPRLATATNTPPSSHPMTPIILEVSTRFTTRVR